MFEKTAEEHAPLAKQPRGFLFESAPFQRSNTIVPGQDGPLNRPKDKRTVWQRRMGIARPRLSA